MTRVYKVVHVRQHDGHQVSAWTHLFDGMTVTYKQGQESLPAFGKLFAFLKREDAMRFNLTVKGPRTEVWEAVAKGVRKPARMKFCLCGAIMTEALAKRFWENKSRLGDLAPSKAPEGTVLCDSITFTERVWP